jgi:deferrochelatase/peroxidase EfeB
MPITLDNAAPLDPAATDADTSEFQQKLQANILKPHGRDHAVFLLLAFTGSVAETKAVVHAVGAAVTSAAEQAQQAEENKATSVEKAVVTLWLTARGYEKLGYDHTSTGLSGESDMPFWHGIAAHTNIPPEDPTDPSMPLRRWDPVYTDAGRALCAAVMIAHASRSGVELRREELLRTLPANGWVLVGEETAAMLWANREPVAGQPPKPYRVEHFGYVDGLSQPQFLTTDEGNASWPAFRPLNRLLVSDRQGGSNAFGSYIALRKLEQNPRRFREAVQAQAAVLNISPEDVCAQVMGRYRSGKPLLPLTAGSKPDQHNEFNFRADPTGRGCPFFAHVRKANPRTSSASAADEKRVMFARRSMPYGSRATTPDGLLDETAEPPAGGVGLLFIACVAEIAGQFERAYRGWLNSGSFPNLQAGLDPITSEVGSLRYDANQQAWSGFGQVVTTRGGAYFFAPSIPFLKNC